MSGYIKYFDNGGKNVSFKIEDESVNLKYMINTLFSDNEIPKERNHYICFAAISLDSVLKVDKKNYPQVYLEQCKYKIKRRKPADFIDAAVDLSSDDSDGFK